MTNKSSVNYSYDSGYSTLFICLIAPLFLCTKKLKLILKLYLLPFFISSLDLIPDIIINHPLIFILMTISNIITLYIVYLSIFDKKISLRKNIIYFFNSLKECKFCPFKIKLLLINTVTHLKNWINIKFKQFKDNLFSILLILFIIIFIANVFRQPIFIYLDVNIFSNFYLYMYIMFSSILPTTYIVTILIK
jgi:hypothetical protein